MIVDKKYAEKLLALVDKYQSRRPLSDTYLSQKLTGNVRIIQSLRNGRSCSCDSAIRLEEALLKNMPKEKK